MMHSYKNKKIVVTGGAGFIGSHIVDALVALQAQVTVLDNFSTGSILNLEHHGSAITVVTGDIQDAQVCKQVLEGCNYVFHTAACVSVPQSFEDTPYCHGANITGTFNLLEAARIYQPEAVIFSSSCAVYGQRNDLCAETMDLSPTSPYAYSKWMGELYCQQYSALFGVPTLALRYFNVYGDRQNPFGPYAGVVAKFKQCLENNMPITIFGDGKQTRDFVPVAQVVAANLRAGLLPRHQLNGQAINCASGTKTTVLDIWHTLRQGYPDYAHDPVFNPERPGDIKYSQAECTKYRHFFGM